MKDDRIRCIDAGSEYCPCYLAETHDCITCAHLQGKNFCECDWNGVCIYQEFFWCGNKKKSTREVGEANIIEKKIIDKKVLLLKIKVTKTLGRLLKHPGSYIFIRDPQKPVFFDIPISIMNADEYRGEIDVAVQILGPKTKSLVDCSGKILIKGPYWNGILGLKDLKQTEEKNILLIGRGVALAPSVLVTKYLLKNKNKVTFMMDPSPLENVFIKDSIKDLDIEKIQVDLRTQEGVNRIREMIKSGKYDLIFSGGSDELHIFLRDEIKKIDEKIKLVITNNTQMCCGEGICGACTCKLDDGRIVKMCKTQMDGKKSLEGRKING